MKTYFKTILRSFIGNAAKLISLTVIMFPGVAFVSGLGTLSPTVEGSLENYLVASDVPDLTVKAGSADGIPEEQLEAIAGQEYVSDVLPLTVMDVQGEKNTRIYVLDDFFSGVNTLGIEGRLPAAYGEVLAERHSDYTEQFSVGGEVTVLGMQCKVVGIASNPLIFDRLGALFLWAVLGYLGFGSLADVKWYTHFLAFGIMMLFTGVTDLILSPKILGIDMTGSLKAND